MLRLNRASIAITPCKSGSIRKCSWGGFQWRFFEPLQVKCCMVYQNSKHLSYKKDFSVPLNVEPKYAASTFDYKEWYDRMEKEAKFLSKKSESWLTAFQAATRVCRVFKIVIGDSGEHDQFIKDKSKEIICELDVFYRVKNNINLDFFLRSSQIVKSSERLDSIRIDILDKYLEVIKKKD